MMSRRIIQLASFAMLSAIPSGPAGAVQQSAVAALATEYLTALVAREPERLTFPGVPGATHDRLSDNSRTALRR
ncbi:MAG TPA: hypothetical protein VFM14_13405 [Gemmatimonadales bacterium]|nr:hypothetical protein [Gemmatimonadales bacterium]